MNICFKEKDDHVHLVRLRWRGDSHLPSPSSLLAAVRLDLDGNSIAHLTICMIGAGGFIDS